MSDLFEQRGAEIYSRKSGKLVATLDEYGEYHLKQGMYSYEQPLRDYLGYKTPSPALSEVPNEQQKESEAGNIVTVPLPDPDEGVDFYAFGTGSFGSIAEPAAVKPVIDSGDKQLVWDIPADQLPEMDPALGVYTPGVREFADRHNMTAPQFAFLIERLEKRR